MQCAPGIVSRRTYNRALPIHRHRGHFFLFDSFPDSIEIFPAGGWVDVDGLLDQREIKQIVEVEAKLGKISLC